VNFDFLGKRKTFYILSIIITTIGIVSLFTRGLDFGVDFKGGRNFVILLDQPVKTADVAQSLTKEFGSTTNVIAFGSDQQIRVTSRYKVNEDDTKVDEEIQQKLYNSLKPYLESGKDYETFMNVNWQSNIKVGPSIADDIQRKAVYAIVFAMIMMFVYIAFRFKDWHFGLGATVALIHDAFFVITIFSLFYGVLPFSLEIDQAFIAAILTVVGYSINDTVVIFDRLREYIGLYPKRDRKEVMNMAINSTLGRTFSTNLTVVLVLSAIFIFGGEVIRGFIFAMFLGSFIGIYSTVFIATPIVYDSMKRKEKMKLDKK
jgi:SecD/SecF fusion protein